MREQFEINKGENNVYSVQLKLFYCLEENYIRRGEILSQ